MVEPLPGLCEVWVPQIKWPGNAQYTENPFPTTARRNPEASHKPRTPFSREKPHMNDTDRKWHDMCFKVVKGRPGALVSPDTRGS